MLLPASLAFGPTGCVILAGAAVVGGTGGAAVGTAVGRQTAAARGPATGAALTVAFAEPVTIPVVSARRANARRDVGADTTWLREATALTGRVTAVRGDTLELALTEARVPTGRATFSALSRVTVVPGPGVTTRVLTRRPGLANGAVIGAAFGVVAFFVAWVASCQFATCD